MTSENPLSIFVVVPVYNEAQVIRSTIEALLKNNFRVVVVDDGSTDETKEKLLNLPIYYLRHAINLGQGAAIQTGVHYALTLGASFIATFDADGQHNASDLIVMLQRLNSKKTDFVFGSRFLPGANTNVHVTRKWVLKIARIFNFFSSGILLSDANNGLRLMTRKAALKMNITENGSTHNAQIQKLVQKCKLKYIECPVSVNYTDYSRKKGIKNINGIRIAYDLILFKIFR